MELSVTKIMEITQRPTPGAPPQRAPKWRVLVGEAKEPLRLAHASYLAFPAAVLALSLAHSGLDLIESPCVIVVGVMLANRSIALGSQTSTALRERARLRQDAGLPAESSLALSGAALACFSQMAKKEAHRVLCRWGVAGLGMARLGASFLTKRLPRANAVVNKIQAPILSLIDSAERLGLESVLLRGPAHCAGIFLSRLNEMEQGKVSRPLDELAKIWQASQLSGAAVEPGSEAKGSLAARLGYLRDYPSDTLLRQNNFR